MGFMGFGPSSEITGYNCERVQELSPVINKTAQEAGKGIVERLHSEIIVPMSTVWYAPEAQTFFEGFATTVKNSGINIQKAFDAFREAVQKAGENWAENTKGQAPVLAAVQPVELILNVSDIKADNNGNVTIDAGEASVIAANLDEVESNIKQDLEKLANDLNAETAFIGHSQADSIQDCFIKVSGEVSKIFKYLTEGEDSLEGQIKKAVKKYQDVSQDISSAFQNLGN